VSDLDEAIEAMTETLVATVGDDAVDIGGELGLLLQARFLARSSGAPIEGVQATAAGEDLESAIGLLTPAAARPDPDPAVVAALGWGLADRYTLDGDNGDRDGAITWLRRVCDSLAPAETAPTEDLRLASLLIERAEERCDLAEATAAIGYAERALADPDGDCYKFARYVLGIGHLVRASIGQAADDLPIAVGHLREAAARLPDDRPDRSNLDARLGIALAMWVNVDPAADGADTLAEALRLLARARREMPPHDAFLIRVRYWLAAASAVRFIWYAGSEADHRIAVSEFEAILDQPALDVQLADPCRIFIAYLLVLRSAPASMRRRSVTIDSSELGRLFADPPEPPAPDAARSALDHLDCVSGTATMDAAYASLVAWLRGCANIALGGGGLAEGATGPSVAAFEEALRLTPEDEPGAGEVRGILGLLYGAQAMREASGRPSSRSVELLAAAARQLGDEHPMLPLLHSVLGGASGLPLDGRVPSRAETTAAIDLLENIIEEVPDDHPARAETLIRLGTLLIGRAFDLDRSVLHLKKLRRKLDGAIGRPAASHLNEAVNHFLLGMAEGIEGLLAPDAELVKSAVDRLKRAAGIAPLEQLSRKYIQAGLIALLCQRYSQDGEFQNLDAAIYYASQLVRAMEGDEISDPLLLTAQYLLAVGPTIRSPERLDRRRLDEMVAQLEALQARMPDDNPLRRAVAAELSTFRVIRGGLAITDSDFGAALRDPRWIAEAADGAVAIARATSLNDPFYAMNLGTAGNARAMHGILTRDRRVASEGIALLAEACAAATTFPEHRRRLLSTLACALRMRYDITRDRKDLNGMISRLEEARRLADEDQGGADMAGIFYLCAAGYHERNDRNLQDRRRAAAFGLSALRERSTTVLLQSTTDRAFDAALDAAGEAADVARWCLADGNTNAVVEALERGRGMVLHAAVADASVPSMLREAGHDELASEWETAMAAAEKVGPDPWDLLPSMMASLRAPADVAEEDVAEEVAHSQEVRLPDDLRYRVVKTLKGTELDRLLAPPPVTEIVQALRTAGAQALVYLVPRDGNAVGLALVIDDAGEIREIRLPLLAVGPRGAVGGFAQAQRDLHGAPANADDARVRWRRALDSLCDWAWTAAMDLVLDSLAVGPGRSVRLVLVPVGDLSLVPWHAARRAVAGGEFRYACQDAIISYAASARQFTEACRNRHRPWPSAAALVRVSGSRLFFASKEIQEIHLRHYADGILLGGRDRRSLPATAENVRDLLPRLGADGVSLLHLGCHAEPAPRPVDGRLVLEDGETLSMRDILQQTRARPHDSPGCLVVLAACGSDLTAGCHDEALTLATSFLAAGAVGAVGARWPVADLPTMALMTMFHHYLNSGYGDPSAALRAAQGWMLNPDRSFPEGFHPKIAEMVRTIDLAKAECWAAFTYQGQ
jgi:tetratricopeptide (TPR) repeat protein